MIGSIDSKLNTQDNVEVNRYSFEELAVRGHRQDFRGHLWILCWLTFLTFKIYKYMLHCHRLNKAYPTVNEVGRGHLDASNSYKELNVAAWMLLGMWRRQRWRRSGELGVRYLEALSTWGEEEEEEERRGKGESTPFLSSGWQHRKELMKSPWGGLNALFCSLASETELGVVSVRDRTYQVRCLSPGAESWNRSADSTRPSVAGIPLVQQEERAKERREFVSFKNNKKTVHVGDILKRRVSVIYT